MSRQKWCCCLPLSWSVYASTFICWVTQLALSILFITQGSYPSYGTIGVCCMFFIIAIVGILRQNTCMLRFYQIYTTLLLIGLIGIIGWMCYITVRGDDNVFYDNCVADKYYDNGCKGDARRIAILAIIFALVGLAAVMTALRSVHTYIDYIVMKRMARPDPCCQAPPPAPLPQPGMNVNVVVQPQTGGYPVSYVYATQPGVHYQQQPTVPPAYQPVYPTYPAQTPSAETWATFLGNSVEYLVFTLAANLMGIAVCPLNPALKTYEIQKYAHQAGVQRIVVEKRHEEKTGMILEVFEQKDIINLEDLMLEAVCEAEAQIFFSSGTSGPPKAVELSNRSLNGLVEQIRATSNESSRWPLVGVDDVVHGVLPFFHAATIEAYKVTVINVVPPVLSFLATSPLLKEFDLESLRMIYVGAARVAPDLIAKTRDAFSQPVQIVQLYGMTEAGLLIFMTPPDNDRLDSVGLPLPGVEYKILDPSGNTVNVDIPGELYLRTPCLLAGYRNGEKLDFLSPDGWFPSGDLARVDADGFVSIVGRTKEMIKVRGWQVSPYELEEAIKSNIFGVEDVAVIGVEVEEGLRKSGCTTAATVPQSIGQRPYAFVVGPECDPEAVNRFVEENFVSYKHLAGVSIVGELPRTASGKLCRHKLLEFPRTVGE
ncbi:unnamed protein product, partial [Mesorhabditis spiculigera]